jgi:hypothetical protein
LSLLHGPARLNTAAFDGLLGDMLGLPWRELWVDGYGIAVNLVTIDETNGL